jgi:hypothetical protein
MGRTVPFPPLIRRIQMLALVAKAALLGALAWAPHGHGPWGPGWGFGSPIGYYGGNAVVVQNNVQYEVVNGQLVALPVGAVVSPVVSSVVSLF